MKIIVNLKEQKWTRRSINYGDVVMLANLNHEITHTITYRAKGREGTMVRGDRIATTEGMIFNVADTSRA